MPSRFAWIAAIVLYWMIAARRPSFNFALDRALHGPGYWKPIVILEALRVDYPLASDRLHRFVIDGMRAIPPRLPVPPCCTTPTSSRARPKAAGSSKRLARDSAVIVTDDYPCFFLPQMVAAAGPAADVAGVGGQ